MWFLLIATVVVGGLLYYYLSPSKKNYWEKHGIKEIDASSALSMLDLFLGRKGLYAVDSYAYKELGNEKFCGLMEMGKPMILVKDLDLIKKLLIKDFDYFSDRRQVFTEHDVLLKRSLIGLEGDEWKGVRSSVSPTFTTGKIRRMMEYFNSVGQEWVEDLTRKTKESGTGSATIDILKFTNGYTVDVIASAVFGLDAKTIRNPNSTFAAMVSRVTEMNWKQMMKFGLMMASPKLFKLLKFKLMDQQGEDFFGGILEQGLKARMKGEVTRNDFLQLLVEAKKGELKAAGADELSEFEKDAQIGGTVKKQYLTEEIMLAQCFIFFGAGFSTTSNFITFSSYILAANQDIQLKLRKEVDKLVSDDGSLDYDILGQHVYLDMFVCEVLRIFPGSHRLERCCVKDYKDPETGLVVPKGTLVVIPVNGIHQDEQYYENPEKFDPEHFSAEKKALRNPYAYMPFGIGPRNCIGMRFALIESKAAIVHLVHNFLIEPTPKTPLPPKGRPAGVQVIPPKNLELKFTPIRS